MKPEIRRAEPSKEFTTQEHCLILEVANDPSDPDVSIARARVLPGVTTEWHRLEGTAERYVVVRGTGRVEIGELPPAVVREGDVVRIPANVPQRITNIGNEDLVFFCVCSPRFVPSAYIAGRDTLST
jgi:mannose-6-phosphate isomerase-like protein (cupin superfamily)